MKKIIYIVIALFVLNNCGYTPIYSSKNNNFYIDISQKNRSKLNSKIENNIKLYYRNDLLKPHKSANTTWV